MRVLFVAWQDPLSREWHPVGRLTFDGLIYQFNYTKGAKQNKNFLPFGNMRNLGQIYQSDALFPLFSNRLLTKSRPEYKDYLHWLNVKEPYDDLALLALTEGRRETDSLEVFACPEPDDHGKYHTRFFAHGIRYLNDHTIQLINNLRVDEKLLLMPDPQNLEDRFAIALRNSNVTVVGYCPRYLTHDFHALLRDNEVKEFKIFVERVNPNAPIQLRLLCKAYAFWPSDFKPCSGEDYEPISGRHASNNV